MTGGAFGHDSQGRTPSRRQVLVRMVSNLLVLLLLRLLLLLLYEYSDPHVLPSGLQVVVGIWLCPLCPPSQTAGLPISMATPSRICCAR